MENEIRLNASKLDKTRREMRLAAFAKSHFIISGIGFAVAVVLFALTTVLPSFWDFWISVAAEIVLLVFYATAGFWHTRKNQWTFSGFREGLWAFLDPALIAWGWAALVLLSMGLNIWPLLMGMFFASAFLASPSFLMVLLALTGSLLVGEWGFVLWAVLAGGVPPLLFVLGSLWGSRKGFKTEEETQKIAQEGDADV